MVRSWLLFALVGCDKILGLGTVEIAPDAAIDAPGPDRAITGRISQLFIHNDTTGNPTTQNVGFPANVVTLAYETQSGSTTLATDAEGNFALEAPEGRYRLSITTEGDPVIRELVFATSKLNVQVPVLTRPDVVPVSGANIEIDYALASPVLFSSGIWKPQVKMFTFGSTATLAWPFMKLDAGEGDRIFAIEYESDPTIPTGENHITKVVPAAVTLMDGVTSKVTTGLLNYTDQPNPHALCLNLDPSFTAVTMRLPPETSSTLGHVISTGVLPAPGIAPTLDLMPVTYDAVSSGGITIVENPFGLPFYAVAAVSSTRQYGNTPLVSRIAEWHAEAPTATCSPTPDGFDVIEAPIVTQPTLGGIALDKDDKVVDRHGQPTIQLTWSPAVQTIGWEIELAIVGTPLTPTLVHAVYTDQNTIDLDSSLFVPGQSYVLTFTSLDGLTDPGSGDFESAKDKFAATTIPTPAFTVQ